MANKILLVTEAGCESVAVGAMHSYAVQDGFLLVDVTPWEALEPRASAQVDATEICRVLIGGKPAFRPATAAEVETFRKRQAKEPAQADPPAKKEA